MTVLIISSLTDGHARAVISELDKLGARIELLDLGDIQAGSRSRSLLGTASGGFY